jgi:hypothetical protein
VDDYVAVGCGMVTHKIASAANVNNRTLFAFFLFFGSFSEPHFVNINRRRFGMVILAYIF